MTEFERKFIVSDTAPSADWEWEDLAQGYLFGAYGYALRVRSAVRHDGHTTCTMTLKGPRSGLGRPEAEWEIPQPDASSLMELTTGRIAKRRFTRHVDDLMWTVDVFAGDNEGLVLAEAEGPEASVAAVALPDWVGEEVTQDERYTNAALAAQPYRTWANPAPGWSRPAGGAV
ncbi:MAG: CYTH domain-containing protein [Tetrasphaera sp.]